MAERFRPKEVTGIPFVVDQVARVDVQLEVGSTSQQMTLTGESAPLLQATEASVGLVVEQQQVVDLPLNGRSFTQLMQLSPGASGTLPRVIQFALKLRKSRESVITSGHATRRETQRSARRARYEHTNQARRKGMNNSSSIGRREVLATALAGAATAALDAAPQEPAPKKVRYGVVGTGPRSTGFHLPCIKRFLPEIEVVALCDITPENLQKGHAIFPDAATYDDHQRMLAEQKDLDAVVIIIPNYVHAEVAVHALEAGKHVLVEKPMAIHLAEADRMIAAARKNNRVLQVGLQNRFSEGYRHLASMIRDGAIGDVEMVFASVFRSDWNKGSWQYTDPVTGKKTNWRFLSKTCGSALLEDGIHELDVIHWLVDSQPTRIHAQGGNAVFKDRETIDNAGLLVEFANGARLTFGYSIFTPLPNPRQMRIFGSKGEIHVEGRSDGAVVVQPYHGQAERVPFTNLRADEAEWKDAGNFDVNTTREHRAFAKSITTGAPVVVSGQVGRDAIHISLAAERSLRNGRSYRWQDEADI